ncbi:MAG: biopolymer transporter ExbD [Planctomycetota bacterium]
MKLTKTKRSHSVIFNITPMIDIVFLLLIFFMTVSQITQSADHPLKLSQVNQGTQAHQTANLTINLDTNGQIIIAGKVNSFLQFQDILARHISELDHQPEYLKVKLRCAHDCPTDYANRMIKELSERGVTQVIVAVTGESPNEAK